ncbi:MAG: 2-amino-5-chloromuconate deaminase CnbZ [Actinomycetota bacterium]
MASIANSTGGYAYLPGPNFASDGVIALPDNSIHRAVLSTPPPLREGFSAIRSHLESIGRPVAALCGMEIRMPAALSLEEFLKFNDGYLAQLDSLSLLEDGASPLARTNVAPTSNPPTQSSILAFSYTVPEPSPVSAFVISGVPELPEGATRVEDAIRAGETSADALFDKARVVVDSLRRRIHALGAAWDASASVHLYSGHDVVLLVQREILAKESLVSTNGIVWHDAVPPVLGLELEIDVRRYSRELMVYSK